MQDNTSLFSVESTKIQNQYVWEKLNFYSWHEKSIKLDVKRKFKINFISHNKQSYLTISTKKNWIEKAVGIKNQTIAKTIVVRTIEHDNYSKQKPS